MSDLVGKIVSEEEVASDLGFTNVFELRRWSTEIGNKCLELEAKVREYKSDADRFKWHGERMVKALELIEPLLTEMLGMSLPAEKDVKKALDVLQIILGKKIDWDNEFHEFLRGDK
jgi:hypothetical protein